MKRIALPACLLAATMATGCSITTPQPDQKGIVYDAGMFSDTTFQNCIDPGSRDVSGPGDQGFVYPNGQRTFEFANKDSAESKPLTVVTKDNLEMTVSGVATFSLTTDCGTLRKFHEQIGLKFKAYEDEGWNRLLGVYIGQPLDRAMDAAAKAYGWKDLFSNPTIKQEWEKSVATYAAQFIKEQGGEGFFGGFSVTLQQPQPPQGVRDALASAQQAVEENTAQKAKNEKARTEMEAIKALVEVLGPEGAVMWQAVKDGRVSFVVSDGGVSVAPKR
ncbi:SPFH domain / Band 7 family protein [Nonomuraea solani]|uniref:SPFH domain / Band 7 family protein n=1 Tax=Nonomuraea solani TaxID=1144553 RepID=A0A1H6D0N9_9ACTN|nr:SPFH domain-containing protein [Nonomuraea solani]SEG78166.1 SPFH domain / Band 7 family protein [Nonomuraea solani]